jgi:hypothetical protein
MNCANHPDQAAVAFCRTCGKPLCQSCQIVAQGTIYCQEHQPAATAGSPYAAPPYQAPHPGASPYAYGPSPYTANPGVSPGLAFLLGMIPGVGAIYNGQYAKGLIHAVIFGFLVSIPSSGAAGGFEPLFGLMIAIWFFYMAFEAYHTAQKRLRGEAVDEFSSIFPMGRRTSGKGFPAGPVVIIAVGVIFLLNTLELVRLHEILRWWPVFLIVLGGYMLYLRVTAPADAPVVGEEVPHER